MSAAYENMVDYVATSIQKRDDDKAKADVNQKAKRPLKMPKNYDFSVRNVNWKQYKDDYLLRTDAVWEKSKLLDLFYTHYKSKFVYDSLTNRYMIHNIR